jgi:hypothetical protein
MSALSFVANPIYHARTKHIEVDYHYVREKVLNKYITVSFISIADQIVDIFTKGLSSARFLFSKSKLKVISFPFSLRGHVKVSDASDPPKHIADDHAVDTENVPAALCNYPRAHPSERSSAPPTARSNGYLSSRVCSRATTNVLERSYGIDPP